MSLLTYQQLLQQTITTSGRYAMLKNQFIQFAGHAADLSGNQSPIPIVIEQHLDNDYFDVRFAGRRFRFALTVGLSEQGVARGKVICSEVVSDEAEVVFDFSINQDGDTNIKPPDAEDPIGCNVRPGAWYLVLHGVREGLSK